MKRKWVYLGVVDWAGTMIWILHDVNAIWAVGMR
jgi:hypothetical protein